MGFSNITEFLSIVFGILAAFGLLQLIQYSAYFVFVVSCFFLVIKMLSGGNVGGNT